MYRNTVAASAVITLHYPHGLGYGSQDQSEVHSPLSDHCDLAASVNTDFSVLFGLLTLVVDPLTVTHS